MSTEDISNEADTATDALLDLSSAGKKAAKQRRREIKEARKRQDAIDYAARLAKRAQQDKIDKAEEVLSQIDPDRDDMSTQPTPAPEPTPVVKPEPVVAEAPLPAPVAVEEPKSVSESTPVVDEVIVPDTSESDELQRQLDEANEEAKAAKEALENERREREEVQRQLDDCEKSKEPVQTNAPTSTSIPVVEKKPNPGNSKITIVERANPSNWGWLAWLLALIGLIFGWTVVGEWFEVQSQPSLWDWVAWLFRPVSAMVGFFGGGLIGHFIAGWLERRRTVA